MAYLHARQNGLLRALTQENTKQYSLVFTVEYSAVGSQNEVVWSKYYGTFASLIIHYLNVARFVCHSHHATPV